MPVGPRDIVFPNIRDSIAKSDNNNAMGKSWYKSLLQTKSAILQLNTDVETATSDLTDAIAVETNDREAAILALQELLCPVATLRYSAMATEDSGWFLCNGQAINRLTYANLYAKIGVTYGVGDGSTTFNVPDYCGRTILNMGTGSGLTARTLAAIGGEETHLQTTAELAAHAHTIATNQFLGAGAAQLSSVGAPIGANVGFVAGTTASAGSSTPFNVMQPFAVGNILIKY